MRTAMCVLNLLPEFLVYRGADWLGQTYYRLSRRRQAYALKILRNAFPEGRSLREMHRMARRGTGNLMMVAIDMMRFPRWTRPGRLQQRISMEGLKAKIPAPPLVVVTAHLGSWEPSAAVLTSFTGEAHILARKLDNPLLQRHVLRSRRQRGIILHPRRGGIRHLARALEDGGVAVQVGDQYQRHRGVRAPFFGEVTSCERSAATLALRASCPVLIASCIRQGHAFRFEIHIQAVIQPVHSGDRQEDVRRLVTRINEEIGAMAVRDPDQYLWIHNRYNIKLRRATPAVNRA